MRRTIFEDEHDDFRDAVRQFLVKEALPHSLRWEEQGIIDREFWLKAARQGLVAFAAPEELGGAAQTDFRFNAVLDEEVALTGVVGDSFGLTNDIVAPYLIELANEEQQARWLPGVTAGETAVAIAMTEPAAGSDLRGMTATARRDGDDYVLNGAKTFITNGIQADLIVVAAYLRNDDAEGIGVFVVTADMDGFARGRKLEKVGRRAQDTAELFFDNVRVPVENVLGERRRRVAAT